jgi:hypothetical protein
MWAFIGEYGYDSDIYYGTGGNNMALISNGWFEILLKCLREERNSIIADTAL